MPGTELDPQALTVDVQSLRDNAQTVVNLAVRDVNSDEDFELADAWTRDAKDILRVIDEAFAGPLRHLAEAAKGFRELRDRAKAPVEETRRSVESRMLAYSDRKRREAREAAEREAREREKEARERALREAQAREEAAQRARAAGDEARATMHESAAEEAVERASTRIVPDSARAEKDASKIVASTSVRVTWRAELSSMRALAKAVAEGRVPEAALKLDQTWANKAASLHKEELPKHVPGLRAVSKSSLSQRRA